jgi:hypothetical protein
MGICPWGGGPLSWLALEALRPDPELEAPKNGKNSKEKWNLWMKNMEKIPRTYSWKLMVSGKPQRITSAQFTVRRLARLGQKAKAEEKDGKSSNSTNISGKTDLAKCETLWTRLF